MQVTTDQVCEHIRVWPVYWFVDIIAYCKFVL